MLQLLTLALITTAYSQLCMSLRGSRMCPEFGDYNIEMFNANPPGTTPYNIDTLAKFDSYIESNVMFNQRSRCSAWPSARDAVLRYAKSTACAIAVNVGTREGCNNGKPKMNLCRASSDQTLQDLGNLLKRYCPSIAVGSEYTSVLGQLSTSSTCLVGLGGEKESTCGVAADKLSKYCEENSQASCCVGDTPAPAPTTPPTTDLQTVPTSSVNTAPTVDPTVVSPSAPTSVQQPGVTNSEDSLSDNGSKKSTSPLLNPLYLGIAGGAIVLIALLFSVIMYKRRKDSKPTQFIASSANIGGTKEFKAAEVMFDYNANLVDELTLRIL